MARQLKGKAQPETKKEKVMREKRQKEFQRIFEQYKVFILGGIVMVVLYILYLLFSPTIVGKKEAQVKF